MKSNRRISFLLNLALAVALVLNASFLTSEVGLAQSVQEKVNAPAVNTDDLFGNGTDGILSVLAGQTVTINTIKVPVSASGISASPANSTGFSAGDLVLFHQTQGTASAGCYQLNKIVSINSATSWTLTSPLACTYSSSGAKAQVIRVPQYQSVTVESGGTLTASAWDGSTGGLLVFKVKNTLQISGQITMKGLGYRRGDRGEFTDPIKSHGWQGETYQLTGQQSRSASGGAGGGGQGDDNTGCPTDGKCTGAGGGGGGYGSAGAAGQSAGDRPALPGSGGNTYGTVDLSTTLFIGSGGGGGGSDDSSSGPGGYGGPGAGAIIIAGQNIAVSGAILANGENGSSGPSGYRTGGGGGGAGGSVLLQGFTVTLGSSLINAGGGAGGSGSGPNSPNGGNGGNGGVGRIRVEYCDTVSGITNPGASVQKLTCESPATIQLNPSTLNFNGTVEGTNPAAQTFSISNSGSGTLGWTAYESASWLDLNSKSGTMPSTVSVSVDLNGLGEGTYDAIIEIQSPLATNSPQLLHVTLQVNPVQSGIFLRAEAGKSNVHLEWTATSDSTFSQYRISRLREGGSFSSIGVTSEIKYYDQGPLEPNIRYCYQISALRTDQSLIGVSNSACAVAGQLELWVPNVQGNAGQDVVIPINIRNASGLNIAASDIWLDFNPSVVEVVAISRTVLTANYNWLKSIIPVGNMNRVKISSLSTTPQPIYGEGSLFWLTFRAKNAPGATTPLDLREYIQGIGGSTIYTPENMNTPIPLVLQDGVFSIPSDTSGYILGDLNGDKVVQSVDALIALLIASGKLVPTQAQLYAGDINGNGVIDAADASLIFQYANTGNWPLPPGQSSVSVLAPVVGQTIALLNNVVGAPGNDVQIYLSAENVSNWSGGDYWIVYDPNIIQEITNVTTGNLSQGFSLKYLDNHTGLLRVSLAYAQATSGTGVIAVITARIASQAARGQRSPLLLADYRFYDSFGRDFVESALQISIIRQNGSVTVGSPVFLPLISR